MQAFLTTTTRHRGSRVSSWYSVPVQSIGQTVLDEEQARLTLQAKSAFGTPPPPFVAWFVGEDQRLYVPRFYGIQRFGPPDEDHRTLGDGAFGRLAFDGALTDVQQQALDATLPVLRDVGGAMVLLPCGYGKTVWAVRAMMELGRKACVIVHKEFLRGQWEEALRRFCPGVTVGKIQGKTWTVDGCDVVIAMIQTIAKRGYSPCELDMFGTVCFDECHHIAAPWMNLATRSFRARYVIGLTATKDRPDGLTPLLHWSLGPEAFRVRRAREALRVTVAPFQTGMTEVTSRDGKPLLAVMLNKLATHRGRNHFISQRVVEMYRNGRVIIVLSDRIEQLRRLKALVLASGVPEHDVGFFSASTKEGQRADQLRRRVVMCSFGMANEGLDKREADTCVMATPKGRVTQCIGRIQRPCETKKTPLVLDVADDFSFFIQLRHRRQKHYAKEHYDVQVVHIGADGEPVPPHSEFWT